MSECEACSEPIEATEEYCADCQEQNEREDADTEAERAFDYAIAIGAL